MSLLKTNCYQNDGQTGNNKRYEIVRFAYNCLTRVGHWNIRGLRKVFQVIEQQAVLRVIALSRRDQDRERFPVHPRLFALPRWPLDLRKVSSSSGLESFFVSLCIDAPESTTNSLSSGDFEVDADIALASIEE